MIIELVDDTRLLILLAQEDMQLYDFTFDTLDWQDHHYRKVITQLLRIAYSQTGFSANGKRLMIETVSGDNSCMLLITLLPALSQKRRKKYKIKGGAAALRLPVIPVVYEFEDVDAMFSAAERLYHFSRQKAAIIESCLILYNECYYFLLYVRGILPYEITILLTEYGRWKGKGAKYAAHLREYGKTLAENGAIERIANALK